VGNVLLKFYESVASFIISLLRREMQEARQKSWTSRVFRILDYTEYGGAPLLGVGRRHDHLPRRLAAEGDPQRDRASPPGPWSTRHGEAQRESHLARLSRSDRRQGGP
jgi:hypothetical protein